MTSYIYKIYRPAEWHFTKGDLPFTGSADDLKSGFIHFSTREQLETTLAKHFASEKDIVVAAYAAKNFPPSQLIWEKGSNGQTYPHLYGTVGTAAHKDYWTIARSLNGFDLSALPKDT
ncbi:MAG: DUF952 domain-containing protein [Kordiimonadaceae bacterium]|nr:DUF952 domain-containing protein [Kordiimonadaceae bacterium]